MSVFDLQKGSYAAIALINVDGAAGERLKSLGFKKGARVFAAAFSLFKSGVLVVCGYNRVALRKSVAERIEVEECL